MVVFWNYCDTQKYFIDNSNTMWLWSMACIGYALIKNKWHEHDIIHNHLVQLIVI